MLNFLTPKTKTYLENIIESSDSLSLLNTELEEKTGVVRFFPNSSSMDEFTKFLSHSHQHYVPPRDRGDFQTPLDLAQRICQLLLADKINPKVMVEPTCGAGSFVLAALDVFPDLSMIYAVEVRQEYVWTLKIHLLERSFHHSTSVKIQVVVDDIFAHSFPAELLTLVEDSHNHLLVLGNPPWVTNSQLSRLGSTNLPTKHNLKSLRGLDALTGMANFDIAENIILRMAKQFSGPNAFLAMLCKTNVARNLTKDMTKLGLAFGSSRCLVVDAKRHFGINADACLYITALLTKEPTKQVRVGFLDTPTVVERTFGMVGDVFVADIDLYNSQRHLDGLCPLEWRQGVKHDAAKVFVLHRTEEGLKNGYGDLVEVEEDLLYPFLKGSQLRLPVIHETDKLLLVPQQVVGQDTTYIREKYPLTWHYLTSYGDQLDKRGSVVYKGKPKFSIFGVGKYAFKPYKVAIAGMYKDPIFSFIPPSKGKPVMLDDTSYYLSFDSPQEAGLVWSLWRRPEVAQLLEALVWRNSKRPYTKQLLMRVSIDRLAHSLTFEGLRKELALLPTNQPTEKTLEKFLGKHRLPSYQT